MDNIKSTVRNTFKWFARIVIGTILLLVSLFIVFFLYLSSGSEKGKTKTENIETMQIKKTAPITTERTAVEEVALVKLITNNKDWRYNSDRKSIYTVHSYGKDFFGWSNYFVLEVNSSLIIISALLPRREYEKDRTFNLPTYLTFNNLELVPHREILNAANKGKNENYSFAIDGKTVGSDLRIDRNNEFQLKISYRHMPEIIEAMKNGHQLQLTERLFREKRYPIFSLNGFSKIFNANIENLPPVEEKNYFTWEYLNCDQSDARKAVWLDTPDGLYALNGTAISLVEFAKKNGYAPQGKYSNVVKIGRDHIGSDKLSALIQVGLKLCD